MSGTERAPSTHTPAAHLNQGVAPAVAITFGPCRSRRAAASSSLSPSVLVPSWANRVGASSCAAASRLCATACSRSEWMRTAVWLWWWLWWCEVAAGCGWRGWGSSADGGASAGASPASRGSYPAASASLHILCER